MVAHPYNPAHLVPFVELVGSDETNAQTLQLVKGFLGICLKEISKNNKQIFLDRWFRG